VSLFNLGIGDWGLGTGDWGLGIGDWGSGIGDRGLGTGDWGSGMKIGDVSGAIRPIRLIRVLFSTPLQKAFLPKEHKEHKEIEWKSLCSLCSLWFSSVLCSRTIFRSEIEDGGD
jgi:hypothetical protein